MTNNAIYQSISSNIVDAVRVQPVSENEDWSQIFTIVSEAFGRQAGDGIWLAFNPGWETSEGKQKGAARLEAIFKSSTTNKNGDPNTVFLKATAPDVTQVGNRVIVGMAVWQQMSAVEGYGDPPRDYSDARATGFARGLYPDDESEQRLLVQISISLFKRRNEVIREKTYDQPPAVFVMDMIAVHPDFQRKGIAGKLIQYGLDDAKRRGDLEAITEASDMGKSLYKKFGFFPDEKGIEYELDEAFAERDIPPNIFMRTGGGR